MALAAPSMVHRTGDTLVVRSVVSGAALFGTSDNLDPEDEKDDVTLTPAPASSSGNPDEDADLPQCKIKRNYACSKCSYYTQNPRFYLYHLKNVHKDKIKVYECPSCLYASKHSQKLQRHVHMVHVMGAGRRKAPAKPKPIAPKPTPRPYRRRQNTEKIEVGKVKNKIDAKEYVESADDPPQSTGEGDDKVFKCSLCPFNSHSQTLVTRHERVVHLKKKFFRCIKCNYVTHMKARYTKHVKYHSMPMIKCDMCDFRTPYKWNLDRHNKNHQGDGAFKCSLCNFTADIKQSLTVHEMNHHVPPVGQAVPSKRRNRVGASDTLGIDHGQVHEVDQGQQDVEVVPLDQQENQQVPNLTDLNDASGLKGPINLESSESPKNKIMMKKPKTFTNFNAKELTVKLGEKVINPNDMLQHKNGNVYIKRIKCRICNYRAAWESEMARHELRVHNLGEKKKAPPRPIPNLIPIQNKVPTNGVGNPPILKIPSLKGGPPEVKSSPMSEKDLNDICAKSCPNSSLKDFASLIGDVEAFKTKDSDIASLSFSSGSSAFPVEKKFDHDSSSSPVNFSKSTDAFKKKNASFFDKLKEKLMTGVNESSNLVCTWCGHESKCLSEAVRHQKLHSGKGNSKNTICNGNSLISGTELSSTRCQHCRQRCKTSSDLFIHLQSCVEANKKSNDIRNNSNQATDFITEDNIKSDSFIKDDMNDTSNDSKSSVPHPMENKVFVWNNLPERNNNNNNESVSLVITEEPPTNNKNNRKSPSRSDNHHQINNVNGTENVPGYGTITSKNKSGSQGHNIPSPPKEEKKNVDHSLKKVYKCPHCSFWASTASRFHVHIVGHLNKKPFECSLCAYRSNWRWDITKHIRLKTVRDASHERARVLMTDETGRRNYSKYNKYLTLMRVHEPSAESSGSGRRTKSQQDSSSSSSEYVQQEQPSSSSSPPPSLPALPKLTPAPITIQSSGAVQIHSTSSIQIQQPSSLSHLRPLYPKPPPLQSSLEMKRPHDLSTSDEPAKKKANIDNKKTMWKCKKCFFRDSDRSIVLSHVKEHYKNQNGVSKNDDKMNCEDSINMKQNEDGRRSHNEYNDKIHEESNYSNNANEHLKCPTCPYFGKSENDLAEHIYQYHGGETPDDLFKCFFCPFYVADKQKLIEHMNLHGLQDPDGYNSKGGKLSPKKSYAENGDSSPSKRYKCSGCPYVSNSKSQFLYHKQFHRPRGAPFKCNMCSYNVTRRHLLHQHLRVHGIHVPTQKIKESGYDEMDETMDLPADISPLDTSNMPEIPLVWVSKLGNLTKMFKCRYCPHVNIRKSNIQEHEKMHSQRTKPGDGDSSPSHQQQHHCPDCNYVCNNAGVLSSHAKVHQGLFGQVCSLVDNSRSDEAQIKELNALLGRNEEGPPVITPDEIKKEPKHCSEYNIQTIEEITENVVPDSDKLLRFCNICPARFLFQKELDIHLRFHSLNLSHRCESCSYTARQRPHLLAHYKVHTDEYQDRTNTLCKMYPISAEHPKPKIAVIVDGPGEAGPAWVVVPLPEYPRTPEELDTLSSSNIDDESQVVSQHGNRIVHKQFSCHKCPAQFFKSVALQYHLTLHGGSGRHKCRSCDYAVKTYGNLIKHEAVHEQLEPRVKPKPKSKKNEIAVPTSGTELFRQKTEAAQKVAATPPPPPQPLHIDPEFGLLMHGSPEFVYPTYLKNGRLKEKRYKCHKCPSAFEKREQYKVHLSLHGSKQRYNCEHCDYSVKYYANYIQHLRKHQSNDATKAERKLSTDRSSDEHGSEDISESTDLTSEEAQIPAAIIASQRSAKSLQMSMADQQTLMLLQQRVVSNSVSTPEVLNRCPYCPYSNQRRDGVGSHVKCHSNDKPGSLSCRHCTYTVPQQHFLREHNKLHFAPIKGMRPEAYMKCDRLELWSEPVSLDLTTNNNNNHNNNNNNNNESNNNKILIFKDKGNNYKVDRFLPQLPPSIPVDRETPEKIYINIKTGEIESDQEVSDDNTKEDNKENLLRNSKNEEDSVISTDKQDESDDDAKINDNESISSAASSSNKSSSNDNEETNGTKEDNDDEDDDNDGNDNNISDEEEDDDEEPINNDNELSEEEQMETDDKQEPIKNDTPSWESECSTSNSSANNDGGEESAEDSNPASSCSTTED